MAEKAISDLPAVDTPADTDEFEVNQGGTSKKETRAQILSDAYRVGGTDVAVTDGGTGASDASTARSNLGLGALAIKSTVENADIGDAEITKNHLAVSVFEDNSGIQTGTATDETINAAGLRHAAGIYVYTDGTAAAGNITEITASHAGRSIDFDQDLTLDNAFGAGLASVVGLWVELVNVDTSSHTLTVEAGAGDTGTIDDAGSITIPAGGSVVITSLSNAGDVPVCRSVGDTVEIDFGGRVVYGGAVDLDTVSGALTAAHIGKRLTTSGSITIPTTPTGWWAEIVLGADTHDISFNSTTLDVSAASWAAGDELHVVVTSATTIKIKRTPVADITDQTDFA